MSLPSGDRDVTQLSRDTTTHFSLQAKVEGCNPLPRPHFFRPTTTREGNMIFWVAFITVALTALSDALPTPETKACPGGKFITLSGTSKLDCCKALMIWGCLYLFCSAHVQMRKQLKQHFRPTRNKSAYKQFT